MKEGTWALKPELADEAMSKIDELIDYLYDKFGDDILFDELGKVKRRIEELSGNSLQEDDFSKIYETSK